MIVLIDLAKIEQLVWMVKMTTIAPVLSDIRERIAVLVREFCKLRIYLQKNNFIYNSKT